MHIQWYPGHMTKAKRAMTEDLRMVSLVIELADARVPMGSRNPDIDRMANGKDRIILLNKADLADQKASDLWKNWYDRHGIRAVLLDARQMKDVRRLKTLIREVSADRIARDRARGIKNRPIRAMVCGIPNVGKSTVVNAVAKRGGAAKTCNKPGVTRDKQWIKVSDHVMLLDTPGILWPKFENNETGLNLAFIGSISDDVVNLYQLASELLDRLKGPYGSRLVGRYGIDPSVLDKSGDIILEEIGRKRGHLFKGGQVDTDRTAVMVLDEFRSGKLNRISLEVPKGREGNKDAQSESRS